MFETWSGMPLPVQFLLSFLIILGVIGAIWWTVRRFGSGRLGTSTRGRQPRLAVIDYASVDNRRRLILVRSARLLPHGGIATDYADYTDFNPSNP